MMAFDPVSYAMGKLSGGSSGKNGNSYAYPSPPTESIGKNGDYYFELRSYDFGLSFDKSDSSSYISTAGWEFTALEDIKLLGVRLLGSGSSSTITLYDINGNICAEENLTNIVASQWNEVKFNTSVFLTKNTNYIIIAKNSSALFRRQPSSGQISNPNIRYTCGKTGDFPGTDDLSNVYMVDILVEALDNLPRPFVKQYFKVNNIWEPVL